MFRDKTLSASHFFVAKWLSHWYRSTVLLAPCWYIMVISLLKVNCPWIEKKNCKVMDVNWLCRKNCLFFSPQSTLIVTDAMILCPFFVAQSPSRVTQTLGLSSQRPALSFSALPPSIQGFAEVIDHISFWSASLLHNLPACRLPHSSRAQG